MRSKQTAIIDIGSNSVRLVVYAGSRRVPYPVFNEKVMAGLGAALAKTGNISKDAEEQALCALRRFKLLIDHLGGARTKVVATAAVRDAENGARFVAQVKEMGLPCRVLAPEEEALMAGLGVVSAIPGADGVVGDLGGGSLELVNVSNGQAGKRLSLPFGVLRVGDGSGEAMRQLRQSIRISQLADRAAGRAFYMVGGSWRALAKLDMAAKGYPLPIVHQYRIEPRRVPDLQKLARSLQPALAKMLGARLESAPAAAAILQAIVEELRPSELIASSFGIREGLLYSALTSRERRRDPLLEAARELSAAEAGSRAHGDALDRWLEEAFDDEPGARRLRTAACLIADSARRAIAPFQAARTVEMALHGAWVGVDVKERVLMAQALATSFGQDGLREPAIAKLAQPQAMQRAVQWGLAMRLGERLSAGVSAVLRRTKLTARGSELQLSVPAKEQDLVNKAVLRRLAKLSESLELEPQVVLT